MTLESTGYLIPPEPGADFSLRDYQVESVSDLRLSLAAGHIRQILCAPTGSGKTVIAAHLIHQVLKKPKKRVIFIADMQALIKQTSERFTEFGIPHGVLMGESTYGRNERIQICSAQTLERRDIWPEADLIIVDEAHTLRKAILEYIVRLNKPTIGLTATPFSDGLGKTYSNIINAQTTDQLIEQGWLVPLKVYCATQVDMTGATVNAGEWSGTAVSERVIPIVGDIVSDWVAHTMKVFGHPVKTLVFSATVADGAELCRQFQAAGYRFEQISYRDGASSDTRAQKIRDFREGRIDGLISCEALAKGFDVPDALCLISARPYRKSLAAHIQQIGRIMRSSPGKEFGLVLDHAGNYLRHAYATEAFWAEGCSTLDDSDLERLRQTGEKEESDRECKCGFVMPKTARVCPACGEARTMRRAQSSVAPGVMREYEELKSSVGDVWPHISRVAIDRNPTDPDKALRFAKAQYKQLTGWWPNQRALKPASVCDPQVAMAVHLQVEDFKQRKRAEYWAKRNSKKRTAA